MKSEKTLSKQLVIWYKKYCRPLPWRIDRNPYKIWVSEIMLQQTTTTAVIPYFKKFIARFPNIKILAQVPLEEVLSYWAGLGYYSRARNLHKTSQILKNQKFPQTYKELLSLPGIGPYISRALSSQAFGEKVGVVDGNVIRLYCRLFGQSFQWWKAKNQWEIQDWTDELCQHQPPSDLNQALMELGATICTPKSPSCLLCPLSSSCIAFKNQSQKDFPLAPPKKRKEIWTWLPEVFLNKKNEILFIKNNKASIFKK